MWSHAKVLIRLNKLDYVSGESITGNIVVSVSEPFTASTVKLTYKCHELGEFETDDDDDDSVTLTIRNTLHEQGILLLNQATAFDIGEYYFPFLMTDIPSDLPGSFTMSSEMSMDAIAWIKHELVAKVYMDGLFESDLKDVAEIMVHEPFNRPIKSVSSHTERKVTFLCCIPKGTVSLAAEFSKDALTLREITSAKIVIDNSKSSVDLEFAAFKLVHSVDIIGKTEIILLEIIFIRNK